MSNPQGNSLPECQLNQIQRLVNAATAQTSRLKSKPDYFWLDTLCVPVGDALELKQLRHLCIRKMASIYKGASAALVLSSTIRRVASDNTIESSLALCLSNWNRRLWTLQEGMLAEKILLQFSDRAVNYDDYDCGNIDVSVARGHCVTFPKAASNSAMSDFVILRDFLRDRLFRAQGPVYERVGPLAPVVSMMGARSTSKRSDETICLGALMRLKIGKLQQAESILREEHAAEGKVVTGNAKLLDDEVADT